MAELFGWLKKNRSSQKSGVKEGTGSFAPPRGDDGAVIVDAQEGGLGAGGTYNFTQNFDAIQRSDRENINYYRKMADNGEIDSIIDEIITESLSFEPGRSPVELYFNNEDEVSDNIQEKFKEEFENILQLLDFHKKGDFIFRRWYIDGRLYYHKIVDKDNKKKGIQQLRWIDPRNIKLVREVEKEKNKNGIEIVKNIEEYYIYSRKAMEPGEPYEQDLKIAPEAISYVTSGLTDRNTKQVLSYLHKAIKPFNQLTMLEDSLVIYRLARAPERRVFYVDVGNLPKSKAESYLQEVMAKHKNKLVYDANTGSMADRTENHSMMEDIWLPRKEGTRGTEVTTLQSGQQLGEMDDVIYFQKKLYKSLHIPLGRLAEENMTLDFGRASEITRDEIKFNRFIERLRSQFSLLFLDLLKTQLLLKGIITENEWPEYKENLHIHFNKDSIFVENKEAEILDQRLNRLRDIDNYVGKYFSINWVRSEILKQSEKEIEQIDKEIEDEKKDGKYEDEQEQGGFSNRFR